MPSDLVNLVFLPLGLGLLGFVEPCSMGSSLLFVKYVEGKAARVKVAQAVTFTLTRALVIGALGAVAALVGAAFIGFQRAGWVLLGAGYVVLGIVYLSGKAGALMRSLGPRLGRLSGHRGSVALAALFGLNIPACAAPLLFAILGAAAVGGTAGLTSVAKGFVSLAVFGFALSLPLALALFWRPARRALDRFAAFSSRVPLWIGGLLVALGVWSIALGLLAKPDVAPIGLG